MDKNPIDKQYNIDFFSNKRILVTGGTGSIGEEIVSSLLTFNPEKIVVFNKDDNKQYLMKQKYSAHSSLNYILGDVRDFDSVEYATRNIDIVFHVAALKQVPICEEHPYEAIKTNVLGAQNIIDACILNKVKKVVNVSTDKVVNTTSAMGATKFLSERMFKCANFEINNDHTHFCSVRFGNVIGSRGSVIPLFLDQSKKEKEITITSGEMTRFFMLIPEAAHLTLKAAYYCRGAETFILKMRALKLSDLVDYIKKYIEQLNMETPKSKIIGIRQGEKLHEELIMSTEFDCLVEDDEMYVVLPSDVSLSYYHFKKSEITANSSDQAEMITENEVLDILKNIR